MNLESLDVDVVLKVINESWNEIMLANSLFDLSLKTGESKSTAKATEYKIQGNNHLKERHDREALNCYTRSIAFASKESEELAVAYANRSIVLLYLREYVACLHDINRALETGKYPEHLRRKLLDRKERCVDEMRKECNNKRIKVDSHSIKSKADAEWCELSRFENNPLIPDASRKITIANDESWGRYLVATEAIEPGEILSNQEYYSLLVAQDLKYEHCSYCLHRSDALIPCAFCSQTMYCSRTCSEKAFDSYHRVECKMMQSPSMSKLTDQELLALRMFLIGTEQGNKLKSLMENRTTRELLPAKDDPRNKPFVQDYNSVLKLCRTFYLAMMLDEMIKFFCCDMITILRNIGFFYSQNEIQQVDGSLNETETFVIMLLLNHIISIKSNNNFGIYTDLPNPNDSIRSTASAVDSQILGRGVCVVSNLVNHSCDPNTYSLTRNRRRIMLANRPIKKGEQIFTSYFKDFSSRSLEERQIKMLSGWGFTCQCEACLNHWPTMDGLSQLEVEFLYGEEKSKAELMKMNCLKVSTIAGMDRKEILNAVFDISKWLHINVKKPCHIFVRCKVLIQEMIESYDDFFKSLTPDEFRQKLMEFLTSL